MTNFQTWLFLASLGGNVATVIVWSRHRRIER